MSKIQNLVKIARDVVAEAGGIAQAAEAASGKHNVYIVCHHLHAQVGLK